jgi:AcrR family transcriptional regulator
MTTATARLTRAESQERTRRLIVEAAAELFLRDGFRTTSLERIAEEAGFTRGAVYSNFESKTAMGIAVIDELYAREERRLSETLAGLPADDRDAAFDALASWADSTIGDPAWMRLEIEVAASSAHDDAHRAATAERYARLREWAVETLERRFGEALPIDRDALAAAIVGLGLGLGAQRAADPSVPGAIFSDVLRALVGRG